jgi:hypothetical protein
MKILSSADLYSHRYIELLLPLMCLVYMLQPLSSQSSAPPHVQPQSIATNLQAWEHWKTEKGWPLDRRLIKRVSVWQAKITISDLLAEAQKQTKVKLSAKEPKLQGQQLTVFAKKLPLNALMFQLSQLLGLFWYQRTVHGNLEYIVTYGSTPPELRSAIVVEKREFEEQKQRAMRIADFIEALSLSEEELMRRAKDDPMLVGSMLRRRDTRVGAEILAYMPAESMRQLVTDGHVLLAIEDVPAWVEAGLRKFYVGHYATSKLLPRGVPEDDYVKQFRLFITAEKRLTPADGIFYDMFGEDWQGFRYGVGFLGASAENHHERSARPDWWPANLTAYSFLPFLLDANGEPDLHLRAWLPGKGSEKMVQAQYPDLIGETAKSRESFFYQNLEERQKQREEKLKDCPWKDDAKLSLIPKFPLRGADAWKKATDLLQATAEQSGYSLLGTYFEDHDPCIPDANAKEPLYILLNRIAQTANCSWVMQGTVIRWRHNDWFVLEAKSKKPSMPK